MKDVFNRSQQLILEVLSDGKKKTYEQVAREAGLSYDGVRGRISELVSKGVNIQRLKVGKETVVKLEKLVTPKKRIPLTNANRHKEAISRRLNGMNDFNKVGEFLNELRENEPTTVYKQKIYVEEEAVGVLVLSDLHFGEIIKDEHRKVIFNTKIAKRRLKNVFDNVASVSQEYGLDNLRILMIGDLVDGDSIYRNHTFFIEKPAIEQVKDVVRELTQNINMLVSQGFSIRVDAVRGNHGITNYNNLEADNWDNVVYDMLDLVFDANEKVEFNHYQTDQVKVPVLDRNFVLYHGQNLGPQIKTASGLKEFRGICGLHKLKDNDIVVAGHLHQFGIESDQGKYLIRNGALPDASEYAIKLNMFSKPEQTMLIIEENMSYPVIVPLEMD